MQQTLQNSVTLEGFGIHSGKRVSCILRPAPEPNYGIRFVRTDSQHFELKVSPDYLLTYQRATCLGKHNIYIKTPEHLLAACVGLNVFNLIIELDNEEVPIMDGSSAPFVEAIESAGLKILSETPISPIIIKAPVSVSLGEKHLIALPDTSFKASYFLDYDNSFVGTQIGHYDVTEKIFKSDISSARTYGFEDEIEQLHKAGLAKGGSLENALVIGKGDYVNTPRYPDELVRHKILDLIGDLGVLSCPIKGHFIAIKTGHSENMELVKKLSYL